MAGSYILGPQSELFDLESLTMCAYIYPTTPVIDTEGVAVGEQALLGKWDDSKKVGYGLFINDAGALEFKIGKGRGKIETFSTKKAMMRKVWYKVMVSYDASNGKGFICQVPYLTATNGGHGPSMLHPRSDTEAEKNFKVKNGPAKITSAPFMMASSAKDPDCGRTVLGAHYGHLAEPWAIPEHTQKYNGKIDRPRITNRALSKAEIELIMGCLLYTSPSPRD